MGGHVPPGPGARAPGLARGEASTPGPAAIDAERFTVTLATPSTPRSRSARAGSACRWRRQGLHPDLPGIGPRWIDRRGAFVIAGPGLAPTMGGSARLDPHPARLYNPLIMPDGQHVHLLGHDDPASGTWSISMIGTGWVPGGACSLQAMPCLGVVGSVERRGLDPTAATASRGAPGDLAHAQLGQPQARQPVYAGPASRCFSLSHDGRPRRRELPLAGGRHAWSCQVGCSTPAATARAAMPPSAPDDSYRISVLCGRTVRWPSMRRPARLRGTAWCHR